MLTQIKGVVMEDAVVTTTLTQLRQMYQCAPTIFYHLVMHCRDEAYPLPPASVAALQEFSVVGADHILSDTVKTIVQASVSGNGMAMNIPNPV